MYIETHGIPRSIRLDQAKCLVGNQVKTFGNKNNIDIIEAPVNDHRAIGLVERLFQTIKNRSSTAPVPAAQQTRTSDRNRRSPSYYGFESSTPNSTILPPPKRPRRAGDVESFQPPPDSIVESVQQIAKNQPEKQNISPLIGHVSPPAPRHPPLLEIATPTLVQSMTALEAEEQQSDNNEWDI